MTEHPWITVAYVTVLGVLACVGMGTGAYLAVNDYSSAGAFSVASACVGVLGTLGAQRLGKIHHNGRSGNGRND